MDIQIFTDGKNTVKHCTENGKHIVKVENTKTKNAIFYRGGSRERAKKMFSDLAKSIQNKIFD